MVAGKDVERVFQHAAAVIPHSLHHLGPAGPSVCLAVVEFQAVPTARLFMFSSSNREILPTAEDDELIAIAGEAGLVPCSQRRCSLHHFQRLRGELWDLNESTSASSSLLVAVQVMAELDVQKVVAHQRRMMDFVSTLVTHIETENFMIKFPTFWPSKEGVSHIQQRKPGQHSTYSCLVHKLVQ